MSPTDTDAPCEGGAPRPAAVHVLLAAAVLCTLPAAAESASALAAAAHGGVAHAHAHAAVPGMGTALSSSRAARASCPAQELRTTKQKCKKHCGGGESRRRAAGAGWARGPCVAFPALCWPPGPHLLAPPPTVVGSRWFSLVVLGSQAGIGTTASRSRSRATARCATATQNLTTGSRTKISPLRRAARPWCAAPRCLPLCTAAVLSATLLAIYARAYVQAAQRSCASQVGLARSPT